MSDAEKINDWLDEMADAEIAKRSDWGEQLQRDVPAGIETFTEFLDHLPLTGGLDFITASEAWTHYQKRVSQ